MAAKLVKYYQLIEQAGGPTAKMRLAMMTVVPSMIAASAPDSPEIIARFCKAYREIVGTEPPPV